MDRHRRKEIDRRLSELSRSERARLYQRALKLRSAAARNEPPSSGDRRERSPRSWQSLLADEPPAFMRSQRRTGRSVHDWMLKLLDEETASALRGSATGPDGSGDGSARRGTVLHITQGACSVFDEGDVIECSLPPEIAAVQKSELAVGDRVVIRRREDGGVITTVLPRTTVLSRPDPLVPHRERVIACNIEAVVVVASVKAPPLHVRLIDRCLVAIQRSGAEPVLCINKLDLLETDEARRAETAKLDPYRPIGCPIVFTSAETGAGIDELRAALRGKRCVFVGHSGVGKSSILNALDPALGLLTRTISEASQRGRHTTTSASLFRLDDGTEVIDTPGIRQFGLWKIERDELHRYFPEFEPFAAECRFRDCSHVVEPDCAVRDAAGDGRIAPPRFETYRRILATLAK